MSITATFIFQMIVFLILVGFTMKFIWPPITAALDERAKKIADGLSAADKAKAELTTANKRVEEQLAAARTDAAQRLADAERLANSMIEEAKGRASEEGAKIVAQAKADAEQESMKASGGTARAGRCTGRQGSRGHPAQGSQSGRSCGPAGPPEDGTLIMHPHANARQEA